MDELQSVWRTMSSSFDGGFRVWEVIEVIGELSPRDIKFYERSPFAFKGNDEKYYLAQCFHEWTEDRAQFGFTNFNPFDNQLVHMIYNDRIVTAQPD
jgi:hypothetical protein